MDNLDRYLAPLRGYVEELEQRVAALERATSGPAPAAPDDEIYIEDSGTVRSMPNPRTPLHIQDPPAAEMPSPTQAFDTLPAAEPDRLTPPMGTIHFTPDPTGPNTLTLNYDPCPICGKPNGSVIVHDCGDPIRHLVPPADQWPADAVAWSATSYGYSVFYALVAHGNQFELEVIGTRSISLPPGYDWTMSLRLRPQTGA